MVRKHISLATKLEAVLRIARCSRCGEVLGSAADVDWHHNVYAAIGGSNDADNLEPLHRECHRAITVGSHVPLSGDISKIAKVKRLAKKEEAFRAKLLKPTETEPCRKSRWPKGRKMRSR